MSFYRIKDMAADVALEACNRAEKLDERPSEVIEYAFCQIVSDKTMMEKMDRRIVVCQRCGLINEANPKQKGRIE